MRCPSHGSRRPHQLRNSRRTAGEHFGIIQRVLVSDSEKKQLKELPKQWVCGDVMYIHKIQQHSRNVYNVSSINWKTCITCIQGMCQVYSGCFTCTSCADMVNSTAGSWSPHFPTVQPQVWLVVSLQPWRYVPSLDAQCSDGVNPYSLYCFYDYLRLPQRASC